MKSSLMEMTYSFLAPNPVTKFVMDYNYFRIYRVIYNK